MIELAVSARVAVLVEGASDAAVVRTLADACGIDGSLAVVDMGGVTNARRHLQALARDWPGVRVLGLCDAPEERYVIGALRDRGLPVSTRRDLADHGFFVCEDDLEDELIDALGTEAALEALADIGDLDRFGTFCRQPEWRERELRDQLHRFAGSGSGRKLLFAQRMGERLTTHTVPAPLARLIAKVEQDAG